MAFSFWNWFQSGQIASGQATADQALARSRGNAGDVTGLEQRIDTLSLATHAMWEILSKKYGLTEDQLLQKMDEIDMRDGYFDGKLSSAHSEQCPDCGHKVRKRRANCYWCGANLNDGNPFTG